jgi:hypothetical protein
MEWPCEAQDDQHESVASTLLLAGNKVEVD